MKTIVSRFVRIVAALLVLTVSVPVAARADGQESRWGSEIYKYLSSTHIIVDSRSPLYQLLNPISNPLKEVADPRYDSPFLFIIGRDPYPNVASTPGGQVYVSDKAFDVIRYREELAGAMCHAVAHTVRHDEAEIMRKKNNASLTGAALVLLLIHKNDIIGMTTNTSEINNAVNAGNAIVGVSGIAAAAKAESDSDNLGADLCAKAGLNPWGLVWLLDNYKKNRMGGRMEMLPDFPADRVRALKAHLASNPDLFGKFDPDREHGTPLKP